MPVEMYRAFVGLNENPEFLGQGTPVLDNAVRGGAAEWMVFAPNVIRNVTPPVLDSGLNCSFRLRTHPNGITGEVELLQQDEEGREVVKDSFPLVPHGQSCVLSALTNEGESRVFAVIYSSV